jgi:hypothetical protein
LTAPREVLDLVDRFHQHRGEYAKAVYKEAQVCAEFIMPMFEALGWDVYNRQGYAEAYKEVVHQHSLRTASGIEAPDYCFRVGGTPKFFLEAKKPAINVGTDLSPAYQLRRYAWTARLSLSVLTDFEELAVYDTRLKPTMVDKASVARIQYLPFDQYPDRWSEIESVFSRDAVLKGSFDKFAEASTGKKGTSSVDAAFLKEIETWRDEMARNLALRNKDLSVRELNFAVQRTIDRILFLRICEDRGIENYGRLQALLNGHNTYGRLYELFEQADERYNSGLFHFKKERDRDVPDELSPNLILDDKVLKGIIERLYYPESPYEFSILPADVLGQVYEQFLGKVIRLTAGHQAKVEDKPEVKKAGGVYYTPTYIVEYIVKNTVGKLLEGCKSPKDAAKLSILDPACGSGSFLIVAYQTLLDWHLDWYSKNNPEDLAKKSATPIYQAQHLDPDGSPRWVLTTAEKKRILLNGIYGVDIDSQAVEVTKLSLMLKVLEGESEETINAQMKLFHERALPDLSSNIKCGNSLIGSDFYDGKQLGMLVQEEMYRVNVFDWKRAYPEIMEAGGFDAVIGNPPWGADFSDAEQEHLRESYASGRGSGIDSYAIFMESAIRRLRIDGYIGFITPDTFLRKRDHLLLRELLFERTAISELVETGPVFPKVRDTWCAICIARNSIPNSDSKIHHLKLDRFIVSGQDRLDKLGRGEWDVDQMMDQHLWAEGREIVVGYLSSEREQCLVRKMEVHPTLGSARDTYRISRGEEGSKFRYETDPSGLYRMITPADVERFGVLDGCAIRESSLTPGKLSFLYMHPKIWIIRIQKMRWRQRIVSAIDLRRNTAGMKTLQIIISPSDDVHDLKYLQGLLASRLMNFWCINYLADDLNQTYLENLPIRILDLSHPDELQLRDQTVLLVDRLTLLRGMHANLRTPAEHEKLQGEMEMTDRRLDRVVYEIYGLTDAEIELVERDR